MVAMFVSYKTMRFGLTTLDPSYTLTNLVTVHSLFLKYLIMEYKSYTHTHIQTHTAIYSVNLICICPYECYKPNKVTWQAARGAPIGANWMHMHVCAWCMWQSVVILHQMHSWHSRKCVPSDTINNKLYCYYFLCAVFSYQLCFNCISSDF